MLDRCYSHSLCTNVDADYGEFTDRSGCFCPEADTPLLAARYKYISTIGHGQSAIVIEGQVCVMV